MSLSPENKEICIWLRIAKKHPRSREDQSSRESVIRRKAHFFFLYSVDCSNPAAGSVIRPRQLLYAHLQISSLRCRLFQPSLFSRLSHHLAIHSFLTQHYPYYNTPEKRTSSPFSNARHDEHVRVTAVPEIPSPRRLTVTLFLPPFGVDY